MTFHSGKTATCTVNGTEVPLIDWSAQPTSTIIAFRNSKTGSFPKRESTFKDLSVTFSVDFDFDANPFASPIGLVVGANITNLKLFLNGTAGLFWNVPSSYVESTPQTDAVEGKPATAFTCLVDGTFAYPGAITP